MDKLRLILLPFSWIYGSILAIRNYLYDKGIIKSETISIPSICVGNLSMGGTGKTPGHLHRKIPHRACAETGLLVRVSPAPGAF